MIGTELRETLYRDAQYMKQGTDTRDEEILQRLVWDALAGERLTSIATPRRGAGVVVHGAAVGSPACPAPTAG